MSRQPFNHDNNNNNNNNNNQKAFPVAQGGDDDDEDNGMTASGTFQSCFRGGTADAPSSSSSPSSPPPPPPLPKTDAWQAKFQGPFRPTSNSATTCTSYPDKERANWKKGEEDHDDDHDDMLDSVITVKHYPPKVAENSNDDDNDEVMSKMSGSEVSWRADPQMDPPLVANESKFPTQNPWGPIQHPDCPSSSSLSSGTPYAPSPRPRVVIAATPTTASNHVTTVPTTNHTHKLVWTPFQKTCFSESLEMHTMSFNKKEPKAKEGQDALMPLDEYFDLQNEKQNHRHEDDDEDEDDDVIMMMEQN